VTDSLSEEDVRRVDEKVDPTAVTREQIEDSLNDDFEGGARDAFAEALEQQRAPVRDAARDLLSDRITTNPASGESQLRTPDGRFGPSVENVEGTPRYNDESGTVSVRLSGEAAQKYGETMELGTVDLSAGARQTRTSEYSA
jgi:hypothetical protein